MKTNLLKFRNAVLDHILGGIAYVLYYSFFFLAVSIDWVIRKSEIKKWKEKLDITENFW